MFAMLLVLVLRQCCRNLALRGGLSANLSEWMRVKLKTEHATTPRLGPRLVGEPFRYFVGR